MFDYKLLIHVTSIIAGIMDEIKLVRTPISVQRISIVPAEKKFGKTGMHASVLHMVFHWKWPREADRTSDFEPGSSRILHQTDGKLASRRLLNTVLVIADRIYFCREFRRSRISVLRIDFASGVWASYSMT
jgi:hypothetical protein